jgi:3-methyladenine DNA glycosylase/8-oxoguanine DNA glycosylase
MKDLPTIKETLEFGERWRPTGSAAAWYLWRGRDPGGGEK